jgi:hypothetical protein
VLDTNTEALLRGPAPVVLNVANAYAASPSAEWLTLTAATVSRVSSLSLPEDTRRTVAAELAGGYAVVVPSTTVLLGSESFAGWWRIDPKSGNTLGIDSSGWGGGQFESLVEYANELKTIAFLYHRQILMASVFANGFIAGWYYCNSGLTHFEECLPNAMLGGSLDVGMAGGFPGLSTWNRLGKDTRGGVKIGGGGANTGPFQTPPELLQSAQENPDYPWVRLTGGAENFERADLASAEAYQAAVNKGMGDPSARQVSQQVWGENMSRGVPENILKGNAPALPTGTLKMPNAPALPSGTLPMPTAPTVPFAPPGQSPQAPCPAPCISPLAKSVSGMNFVQDVAGKSGKR